MNFQYRIFNFIIWQHITTNHNYISTSKCKFGFLAEEINKFNLCFVSRNTPVTSRKNKYILKRFYTSRNYDKQIQALKEARINKTPFVPAPINLYILINQQNIKFYKLIVYKLSDLLVLVKSYNNNTLPVFKRFFMQFAKLFNNKLSKMKIIATKTKLKRTDIITKDLYIYFLSHIIDQYNKTLKELDAASNNKEKKQIYKDFHAIIQTYFCSSLHLYYKRKKNENW